MITSSTGASNEPCANSFPDLNAKQDASGERGAATCEGRPLMTALYLRGQAAALLCRCVPGQSPDLPDSARNLQETFLFPLFYRLKDVYNLLKITNKSAVELSDF